MATSPVCKFCSSSLCRTFSRGLWQPGKDFLAANSMTPMGRRISTYAGSYRSHNSSSFHVTNLPFRKGQAKDLIYRLSAEERNTLLRELQALQAQLHRSVTGKYETGAVDPCTPPTGAQLRSICLHNAMPFIGFGFLDNFIMIVAGDYIDMTIGATLGISTMAAAALGNMVSDVAGIGSAWYVENIVAKIGIGPPPLSPEQLGMMSTRWSSHLGRALGVSLGCLIGMFPLFFMTRRKDSKKDVVSTSAAEN